MEHSLTLFGAAMFGLLLGIALVFEAIHTMVRLFELIGLFFIGFAISLLFLHLIMPHLPELIISISLLVGVILAFFSKTK